MSNSNLSDLWIYLISINKYDLIDFIHNIEKGLIDKHKSIKIKRQLVPNKKFNDIILQIFIDNGYKVIYEK